MSGETRPFLVGAAGQRGRVTVPLTVPASSDWPGNPGTLVELEYEVTPVGGLQVRLWIDTMPADAERA